MAAEPEHSKKELEDFIHEVWRINPDIQFVQSELTAAKATARARGRPLYNPQLELAGQTVRDDEAEDFYTVGISQTLDLSRKRSRRRVVGESMVGEAEAVLAAQRLKVGSNALIALSEYHAETKISEMAKYKTELLENFVTLTEKSYNLGDIAQVDLDQARLVLSEAIVAQAMAEISATLEQQKLRAITNNPGYSWPLLPPDLPLPPSRPVEKVAMLQQIPTIQILDHRVSTATAQINVAQSNTRPDPTITLEGGQEDAKTLIGMSVSIPLFVRNNYKAEVDSAYYQAVAADEARQAAVWEVMAQLDGTSDRYHLLFQAYKSWRNITTDSLGEGILLLNKLWEAGEINTTDYLIQLQQRVDSQMAGVELEKQAWVAWMKWLEASANLDLWIKEGVM